MKYRIDAMRVRDGGITLCGWAFAGKKNAKKGYTDISGQLSEESARGGSKGSTQGAAGIRFSVLDRTGNRLPFKYVTMLREDVAEIYGCSSMCGFDLQFSYERGEQYFLVLEGDGRRLRLPVNDEVIAKRDSVAARKREKLLALCSLETVQVAWDYFRENGLRALWKKSVHKIQGIEEDYDYSEWYEKTKLSDAQLREFAAPYQALLKRVKAEGALPGAEASADGSFAPMFSITIPAWNTPEKYLRMLFDSLLAQTYPNFEVIVADGSPAENRTVEEVMAEYAAEDARFRYERLDQNLGISENTNAALALAKGEYIVLCDHDDELTRDALHQVVKALSEHPEAEFIYTDEDKIDFDGKALFEPHFKSDYNPDLLRTVNYICHLSVISRGLLTRVMQKHPQGLAFDPAYDGAQDYDLFLRCTEEAVRGETAPPEKLRTGCFTSERVIHIPKVCYHWRCHKNSTSANPESKLYAYEAGKRAVLAHEKRLGIAAEGVVDGVSYGFYHTIFPPAKEKISVIIPNKDHVKDLDQCIRSLIRFSSHRNLEFIIVENNSTEPETFAYYERIERNPSYYMEEADSAEEIAEISVHVVRWEREFNYSAINNFGVQFASGEYLLFLNNDVELIAPDTFTEMLGLCRRDDVGIVGARLLYEDDTVQHAGVVVGFGGIAGGTFIGTHQKENSYMHRMMCVQDYSAVTAACMMTKRAVFDAAGGFTEELAVAFNDIDYCMKVRALGLLCVYDPYALLHHYESKSRGLEDTPEKVKRFNGEIAIFASRWPEILKNGDPYYNPNLTLRKSNFALRDLTKEKPGEPYRLELDVEKQLKEVEKARRLADSRMEEA
ncbi:MAG: glycosyltransferase family 2 protein [Eubacteriales bacterium]|nr:glycosyltransferase family 2 protein [Eubacteriales bacterium]